MDSRPTRVNVRVRMGGPECGSIMRQGRITLHVARGGFYADVEKVYAMLCGCCGKRSIPGPTALKISDVVERLFRAGKHLDMTGISFHKLASSVLS